MTAIGLRCAPVLQVRDIQRSVHHFTERLGFRVNGIWGEPPCFAIVGRGTVTIMLDAACNESAPIPLNQSWAAYIYVDDIDALVAEYEQSGAEIVRGPEDAPYGCREIDVRDPDGHLICFGQDLDPPPDGPGL